MDETKCDICGKVDGELKALTFKLKLEEPDAQTTLHYCADNEDCYNEAVRQSNVEDENAITNKKE